MGNLNQTIQTEVNWVVYKWGGGLFANGGYMFDWSPSSFCNKREFSGCATSSNYQCIVIPIDPLTAISIGLVTPEELGYPPGILAAFHLLKGN